MKVNMLGFVFRMLLEDIRKIKPTNKHFVFTPEEAQQVIRMLGLLSFGMNKSFEVGIYSKNQVTLQAYSGYGFHGEVNINKDCLQTF
ncbi:MAG: hypothetical protein GY928_17955, partial [Colwellia sp.]|nr:hypothetical protein [Colwellia sp.]